MKNSEVSLKVEYYETLINYIDAILKQISNRTYQIKNAIELIDLLLDLGDENKKMCATDSWLVRN